MKTTHLRRRPPTRNGGFSWGRFPMEDGGPICYRLFRRDDDGARHMLAFNFPAQEDRQAMAGVLKRARRELRDQVDEIDLKKRWGIAA